MRFFVALVLLMGLVVVTPAIAVCDCVDLSQTSTYYISGAHTIIFYVGRMPRAQVSVPYCTLYSDSNIRLMRGYTCDTDRVVVDGAECMIGTLLSSTTSDF